MRITSIFSAAIMMLAPLSLPSYAQTAFSLDNLLGGGVRTLARKDVITWDGSKINTGMLDRYYAKQNYGSTWTNRGGLSKNGKALYSLLKSAGDEGLDPKDYLSDKEKILANPKGKDIPYAEMFLSQAFVAYARDVHMGRTSEQLKSKDIVIAQKKMDVEGWLTLARKKGPENAIRTLRPNQSQYGLLMKALAKTRDPAKRKQIAANLERWRWLPDQLGQAYILVNQPEFKMRTYNNGKLVDTRKVIVGDTDHPTPMFSDRLQIVEFNPEWNVPKSIAGKEFLPKLISNPGYLQANGYRLHDGWELEDPEIDARKIKWTKISAENFPYRIVQGPSGDNALGQVKFLFPNRHNIYLHDTPNRKLFDKDNRALSHGCIRVKDPLDFAKLIFSIDQSAGSINIESELSKEGVQDHHLEDQRIAVHLAYFTVWASKSGKLDYFPDIYGRDALVESKL